MSTSPAAMPRPTPNILTKLYKQQATTTKNKLNKNKIQECDFIVIAHIDTVYNTVSVPADEMS